LAEWARESFPQFNIQEKGLTMRSHELLRLVFRKFGCKNVAQGLRLSLSLVHIWMRPHGDAGSGALNPLDRVARLVALTGDRRPVEWLCAQAGGYFVLNPPLKRPLPEDLLPVEGRVMQEQAHLLGTLASSLGHRLTRPETQALRQEWELSKADMERLVTSCEQ
jgi:hypothetical protein